MDNDDCGIHGDVGEGIVPPSQGNSNSEMHELQCQPSCGNDGTDNIPDSTDGQCNADTTSTPRVLYQNQLEDPDVAAEFDRPMYGQYIFTKICHYLQFAEINCCILISHHEQFFTVILNCISLFVHIIV